MTIVINEERITESLPTYAKCYLLKEYFHQKYGTDIQALLKIGV